MKITKDTMPTEWETKDGELGYKFGFSFGKTTIKDDNITLPINPNFVFAVDGKNVGVFECESITQIKTYLTEDLFCKSVYQNLLTLLIEFNSFVRSKFLIPSEIKFTPPTFDQIKGKIMIDLKHLLA